MNKKLIIGSAIAAAAGIGVYIARRMKGNAKNGNDHEMKPKSRHLTNVFAKAKSEV